jgi:15-cis-phytoene synthase
VTELERSYAWCEDVARKRAKNFYYSFVLLSREQKNAMCAIYAFMRYCDDLSDEAGATRAAIEHWRGALTEALAGRFDGHQMWPAFRDSAARFRIPHEYFYQMIEGVLGDLDPRPTATFADLYAYCYKVASVVGLTIVHIFGFEDPKALELAEKCGIAFQLTNILRDIREDAVLGRQYLPTEDLARFGVSAADLPRGKHSENFVRLMQFEAARARAYYDESWPLVRMVHPRSRASLWALITIYSRLLERIRKSNYDVLSRRVSLPGREKAWIVLRAGVRSLLSSH